MAVQLFAAIDIGSFDLELSVYEVRTKGEIRRLECISYNIPLGSDTYEKGDISYEQLDLLCHYLNNFRTVIDGYKIDPKNVVVVATSAMREARNRIVVEDQIRVRCGLEVRVLSNSEQRFLSYKAIPVALPSFVNAIEKRCAIVDVGYGSMQISMYRDSELQSTQNIRLGALRTQGTLERLSQTNADYKLVASELADHEIAAFCNYYIRKEKLDSIIAVGDCMRLFATKVLHMKAAGSISADEFVEIYNSILPMSPKDMSAAFDIPMGFAKLVFPVAMTYYRMLLATGAKTIYMSLTSLCDGVAADWAERRRLLKLNHDFEQDILTSVMQVNRRYKGNLAHTQMMREISGEIFEATKKIHGMGKREKLLLQIAALLHDVGKFVSMTAPGPSGYDIIMATEILGLSHEERSIVANVVKFNTVDLATYKLDGPWTPERYMVIYRMAAIMRLANVLDRSHKQKFEERSMQVKDGQLVISIRTDENVSLERGLLTERSLSFREAFGLTPVMRIRKK